MGDVPESSNGLEHASTGEVPASTASRRFVIFGGGLLVAVLVPLFVSLGNWQWNKAAVKASRQALLDARAADAPIRLAATPVDTESLRYRRVTVRGTFEPQRQILIDNRVHHDQAGYHVVTPLRIEGTTGQEALRVLVNRGWVPAGPSRATLPEITTPDGSVELLATAVVPGTRFFTLGAEPAGAEWQTVWQNLDLARYRTRVDFPLQPIVLELDPASPAGFVREWPRPDERIERHVGYAWQWYGFAAASVGIWLFFLLRPYFGRKGSSA
jgi:surfeit locus 1 family protein